MTVDMNVLVGVTVRSPASQLGKRGCPSGILVDLQQMYRCGCAAALGREPLREDALL